MGPALLRLLDVIGNRFPNISLKKQPRQALQPQPVPTRMALKAVLCNLNTGPMPPASSVLPLSAGRHVINHQAVNLVQLRFDISMLEAKP